MVKFECQKFKQFSGSDLKTTPPGCEATSCLEHVKKIDFIAFPKPNLILSNQCTNYSNYYPSIEKKIIHLFFQIIVVRYKAISAPDNQPFLYSINWESKTLSM